MNFAKLDRIFISELYRWSIPVLRYALGVVFLWFGLLKLLGASPVESLILRTYGFLPFYDFMFILGMWEITIGLGLWFKQSLRVILALLWLQMAGTFLAAFFDPGLFFKGSLLFLTMEGEFLVKNLVLIAASLVVAGHEVKPK